MGCMKNTYQHLVDYVALCCDNVSKCKCIRLALGQGFTICADGHEYAVGDGDSLLA